MNKTLLTIAVIAGALLLGLWLGRNKAPEYLNYESKTQQLDSTQAIIDSLRGEQASTLRYVRQLEGQIQKLDTRLDGLRRSAPRRGEFNFSSEDTARTVVNRQLAAFRYHLGKRHARDSASIAARRTELRDSIRGAIIERERDPD